MDSAKGCLKVLGLIGLLLVAAIFIGGIWFNNNIDKVADAAADASGIKDAVHSEREAVCAKAKLRSQQAWDQAVNSGQAESEARQLEELEVDAKRLCDGL